MIGTIAAKEIRVLFASPLAWIVLAIFQFILAWIFLARLDAFLGIQAKLQSFLNPPGVTQWISAPLFSAAMMIFVMIIPLFTMRLVAEEARNQTLTLLLSAPVSPFQIIMGKFLGLFVFILAAIGLVLLMSLTLLAGGRLDFGLLAANVLGLVLAAGSFSALGLYISCLTRHPFLAATGGIGALFGLWAVSYGTGKAGNIFQIISPSPHFDHFNQGLLDTGDIAYFLLFAIFFLTLSVWRLGNLK